MNPRELRRFDEQRDAEDYPNYVDRYRPYDATFREIVAAFASALPEVGRRTLIYLARDFCIDTASTEASIVTYDDGSFDRFNLNGGLGGGYYARLTYRLHVETFGNGAASKHGVLSVKRKRLWRTCNVRTWIRHFIGDPCAICGERVRYKEAKEFLGEYVCAICYEKRQDPSVLSCSICNEGRPVVDRFREKWLCGKCGSSIRKRIRKRGVRFSQTWHFLYHEYFSEENRLEVDLAIGERLLSLDRQRRIAANRSN